VQWPSCTGVSSCWLVILIGARILLEQDDGARGEGACQRIVLGRGHVLVFVLGASNRPTANMGVRMRRAESSTLARLTLPACTAAVSRAPIQPAPGSCWPLSSATRFERAPRPHPPPHATPAPPFAGAHDAAPAPASARSRGGALPATPALRFLHVHAPSVVLPPHPKPSVFAPQVYSPSAQGQGGPSIAELCSVARESCYIRLFSA